MLVKGVPGNDILHGDRHPCIYMPYLPRTRSMLLVSNIRPILPQFGCVMACLLGTPRTVSIHVASSPNEFSWRHIFADGSNISHPTTYLCPKLDDGSVSVMRRCHLISNTTVTVNWPSREYHTRIYNLTKTPMCWETPLKGLSSPQPAACKPSYCHHHDH